MSTFDRRAPRSGESPPTLIPTRSGPTLVAMALVPLLVMVPIAGFALASAPAPQYYFRLREVQSDAPVDGGIRELVAQALRAELASRPEWESHLGSSSGLPTSTPTGRDELVAELERRKLHGFELVVKILQLDSDAKPAARPGSRLQRLAVTVRLAVLGTTLPGEKIAFEGEGDARYESEVPETRLEGERQSLVKDAIADAIKQAMDQAVLKLKMPKSVPVNESKRRRKH